MNDNYFMLRYVDLTRNPIETLTRVFDLTGITMHMITLERVESHTSENQRTTRRTDTPCQQIGTPRHKSINGGLK